MIDPAEIAIIGDLASVALLFGIFYRMGVFKAALEAINTRVTRLEERT